MELSTMKMKNKERIKDFKNEIVVESMSLENLLVAYYVKYLPTLLTVWAKRSHKPTLQQAFYEFILVEKYTLRLKYSPDVNTDQPSTSQKKS